MNKTNIFALDLRRIKNPLRDFVIIGVISSLQKIGFESRIPKPFDTVGWIYINYDGGCINWDCEGVSKQNFKIDKIFNHDSIKEFLLAAEKEREKIIYMGGGIIEINEDKSVTWKKDGQTVNFTKKEIGQILDFWNRGVIEINNLKIYKSEYGLGIGCKTFNNIEMDNFAKIYGT